MRLAAAWPDGYSHGHKMSESSSGARCRSEQHWTPTEPKPGCCRSYKHLVPLGPDCEPRSSIPPGHYLSRVLLEAARTLLETVIRNTLLS